MAAPTCGSERQKSHYLTLFVRQVPWAGRRDGLRCHSTLDCIHCLPRPRNIPGHSNSMSRTPRPAQRSTR
ncbi:hypothetical protein EMIT0196P_100041 [Pseudomonas chlororaphis]